MTENAYYRGKTAVVTGAASGMGLATARLLEEAGADVVSLDIRPCPTGRYVPVDLTDQGSIDGAIAAIGGPVHALFNCAGLPHGPKCDPLKVFSVSFIGMRHLTEGLAGSVMPRGSAIVCVSSVAGTAWAQRAELLRELMGTDWDGAILWAKQHPELVSVTGCYTIAKQSEIYYPMHRFAEFLKQGLRINSIGPGPTETGMTGAFEEANSTTYMNNLRDLLGRNSTPEEQARPMLFLNNSELASYITGTNLFVDNGLSTLTLTGSLDRAALGRINAIADAKAKAKA